MGLTQVSTAGVKDDAVTAGKIPANAVGASELADNAVDTAAIADDAVTADKLANAINTDIAAKMPLAGGTFTGDVNVTDAIAEVTVKSTDASAAKLFLNGHGVTAADFGLGHIGGKWNGNDVANIRLESGDDTTNKDDGRIVFSTSDASSTPDERMRIEPNGNVKISNKLEVSHNDWDGLRVVNTNADANGAYLDLAKKSSSMADDDQSGVIRFRADDDAGNEHTYSMILNKCLDVSNGAEDGHIEFHTSYAGTVGERLRITRTGNIKILDGDLQLATSGHGIDFSAVSDGSRSVSSNILDDYEEGSFTPFVSGTTGSGSPAYTANYRWGRYTKIGKLVHVQFDLTVSSWSGASGDLQVGMPIPSQQWSGSEFHYPSPTFWYINNNFTGNNDSYRTGYMPNNSSALHLHVVASDGSAMTAMSVNVAGRIAGSITYLCN